jgi:uncharacterized membrane protein YeaQ/YmgE (transglycosylase-associated protein family)
MGCFMTAALGVIGSIVGGFIGGLLFRDESRGNSYFRPGGFLLSLVGAILVLLIWRMIQGRK